jgi:biotin transport system substrate-specific component
VPTSRWNPVRGAARLSARDLALIASFAALIAALGLPGSLYLFGGAVPITLQTMGIMLAASLLGARRGALAVLVLLVLVGAGQPLLSGGRGGLAVFAAPRPGMSSASCPARSSPAGWSTVCSPATPSGGGCWPTWSAASASST